MAATAPSYASLAANSNSNGGSKASSVPPTSSPVQAQGTSEPTAKERMVFGATVLIGYRVEVQVADGKVYEGVFNAADIDDENNMSIILKYARVIRDKGAAARDGLAERPQKVLMIPSSDLVQVYAKDVRLTPEDLANTEDFEVDAAIGRGKGGQFGRDLQRWQPDAGDEHADFSLEEDSGAGWDQFAVNKAKFGVVTTFREELYTTALDKGNCGISEAEAARIAREIELGVSAAPGMARLHILEERGMEVDDQLDEEQRYGAVIRDHVPGEAQQPRPRGPSQQGGPGLQPRPAGASAGAPAPRAWGSAGAGIAAVAGRQVAGAPGQQQPQPAAAATGLKPAGAVQQQQQQPQQPQRVPAPVPQAVPQAGPRAPGLKGAPQPSQDVRAYAAPFGAGKAPSTSTVAGLALDLPGGNQDKRLVQQFQQFKGQLALDKEQAEQAARLQELKAAAAATASASTAAPASAAPAAPTAVKPAETAAAASAGAPGAGTTATAPASGATASTTASAAPAGDTAVPTEVKKKGLNPFAKAFTLNADAKPFVPGGGAAAAAPSAAASSSTGAAGGAPPPPPMLQGKPAVVALGAGPGGLVGPAGVPGAFIPGPGGMAPHMGGPQGLNNPRMGGPGGLQGGPHLMHGAQLVPGDLKGQPGQMGMPQGAVMGGGPQGPGSSSLGMDHHPHQGGHQGGMGPQGQMHPGMGPAMNGVGSAGGPMGGMHGPYGVQPIPMPGPFMQTMGISPAGMVGPGGQLIQGAGGPLMFSPGGPGPIRPGAMGPMGMLPMAAAAQAGGMPQPYAMGQPYGMPGVAPGGPRPGFAPGGFPAGAGGGPGQPFPMGHMPGMPQMGGPQGGPGGMGGMGPHDGMRGGGLGGSGSGGMPPHAGPGGKPAGGRGAGRREMGQPPPPPQQPAASAQGAAAGDGQQ